jgi:hypothetical protein
VVRGKPNTKSYWGLISTIYTLGLADQTAGK